MLDITAKVKSSKSESKSILQQKWTIWLHKKRGQQNWTIWLHNNSKTKLQKKKNKYK